MSSYTPVGLPFESRQYRCEIHPLYEDPSRCSICESNRSQRQLDRERGESARAIIDQATHDYSTSSTHRDLQQDLSRPGPTTYGDLRSSARDPLYGAPGSANESYYRSYSSGGVLDTGYGSPYPTTSSPFRDPFERSRYANSNQNGDFRCDNITNSNPTTIRVAERPPPDSRGLDFLTSRSRRNGLSGNSIDDFTNPQCKQQ